MKATKFKVNLKSCTGTFFYAHGVLILGGLVFFFFTFIMAEIKKYCQFMSPALDFLAFIDPCTPLMVLWQTFCGFIFAEIQAR